MCHYENYMFTFHSAMLYLLVVSLRFEVEFLLTRPFNNLSAVLPDEWPSTWLWQKWGLMPSPTLRAIVSIGNVQKRACSFCHFLLPTHRSQILNLKFCFIILKWKASSLILQMCYYFSNHLYNSLLQTQCSIRTKVKWKYILTRSLHAPVVVTIRIIPQN